MIAADFSDPHRMRISELGIRTVGTTHITARRTETTTTNRVILSVCGADMRRIFFA